MDINFPEYMGDAVTIIGEHILFLTLGYDEGTENPLDWGESEIWSFNNRHYNFKDPKEWTNDIGEFEPPTDSVLLSYFEHGQCAWAVAGTMGGWPDFRWDGVAVAGIWIPGEHLLKEIAEKEKDDSWLTNAPPGWSRRIPLVEAATLDCDLYTQWCNGNVYYFSWEIYKVKRETVISTSPLSPQVGAVINTLDQLSDYRFEIPEDGESCGGIYGYEEMKEQLVEEITAVTARLQEENQNRG